MHHNLCRLGVLLLLPLWAASCRSAEPKTSQTFETLPMTLTITSSAFEPGEPMPQRYTGEGEDLSPPLSWSELPEGTQSVALLCDDPDAPGGPWIHWVIYNLPGELRELPEGLPRQPQLTAPPAVQGVNSFRQDNTGYRGPMPPPGHGVHHYHFRLFALDAMLELPPGATSEELVAAMMGHLLAGGELVGTYERGE